MMELRHLAMVNWHLFDIEDIEVGGLAIPAPVVETLRRTAPVTARCAISVRTPSRDLLRIAWI